MATRIDVDRRSANGRFARNLALSLSGGAILTVVGAGAALADDGSAGTASQGAGAAHSGDATAVGNRSGTQKNQTGSASGALGNLQVVDQTATVANVGIGVANTGGNRAVGNQSENSIEATQTGASALGPASNTGTAGNTSDGSAWISTGDASAVGNESSTTLNQSADGSVNGGLGGILLVSQTGAVVNAGVALADTGQNEAIGNGSLNTGSLFQIVNASAGLAANSGSSRTSSDGLATIHTGTASAVGNQSDTKVTQSTQGSAGGDGTGGLQLLPQVGVVANVGLASASSGGNLAAGNVSNNGTSVNQEVAVGQNNAGTEILAAGIFASNTADTTSSSDGSAEIVTGDAHATGNDSRTDLGQTVVGGVNGLGFVLQPQVGVVANVGVGVATTGLNRATGNESENEAGVFTSAWIASENDTNDVFLAAPILVASNQATASATSDGSAAIHTGRASATGNHSETDLTQDANGHVDGLGLVLNTQVGVVANVGVAQANTGDNDAIGNTSINNAGINQEANVASDNTLPGDTSLISFSPVTAANSADVDVASDGDASVRTGAAVAVGNTSTTDVDQEATGHAPGLVVDTQIGAVANAGLADANTGDNFATGNASGEDCGEGGEGSDGCGTSVSQTAWLLSGNRNFAQQGPLDWSMFVAGPATATNSVSAFDPSDGSATIRTGDAQAHGNVSGTRFAQEADSNVPGLGGVLSTQAAVVANIGIAAANTGDNVADGNVSANDADLDQFAGVGAGNQGSLDFNVVGPATSSNSAEVGNTSDGTATVGTGSAQATGNASDTDLRQRQTGEVTGLGLTIGTQVGAVVNVGAGIANTGQNTATGNESESGFEDVDGGLNMPDQSALLNSFVEDPAETTLLGPGTASNTASVTNTSDGDACICTGNAVASGNVSSTTLLQDLDLSTTSGFIVLTEAGAVLNAGLGVANTGVNTAVGNSSDNLGIATQISEINDALLEPVDGPQTSSNSLTLANGSDGSGHVGSGNASGTGNQSTTNFAQAATVESGFAVSNLVGGTANAGAGIANAGFNDAMGNDSTNTVILDQAADGSGLVSNQGEGINESDGTTIIGDPQCCGDEDVPEEETPGLPRTGGELQAEATIGLMLLLAGFALRRRSPQLAEV